MSEKGNHITDLFRRYLKGDISRIEQQALDKKVQEDSYLQDAKEGMDQLSKVNVSESLNNLEARLKARVGKNKSKRSIGWMSVAAGFAILITGALLIWQPFEDNSSVADIKSTVQKSKVENTLQERDFNTDNINFEVTVFNQGTVSADSFSLAELEEMIPADLKKRQTTTAHKTASASLSEAEDLADLTSSNIAVTQKEQESSTYHIDGVGVRGDLIPELKTENKTDIIIDGVANAPKATEESEVFNKTLEVATTETEQNSETDAVIAMQSPANAHVKSESNNDLEVASKRSKQKTEAKIQSAERIADSNIEYKTVTGIFTDENGEVLIGANVYDIRNDIGTITDINGTFSIDIPVNVNELTISYTGYQALIVSVPKDNQITASLEQSAALSEVVVTGYATDADTQQDSRKFEVSTPLDGNSDFKKYIKGNLVYPTQANEAGIKGKVVLLFNVDAAGTPIDIEVKKSLGYGCDEEAIRLLRDGPKWTQGTLSEKNSIAVKFK